MFGSLRAVPATLLMAALATVALAAPPQVTTKSDRNGTTTTITQSESSGNGSSRRQITITRRSSSGNRSSTAVKKQYKVGEKVKVDWGNEVNDGEVIGFSRTGWIEVRIDHRGRETTLTLPPDKIWRVPEKKVTAADRKLRTWSSRNGKFTIKAKFVELDEDDNLTLKKENGETLVVALDKLSEGDEKLARQLADDIDQAQPPRRGSSTSSGD